VIIFVNKISEHLWEFHQIQSFHAVGDKDELIDFELKISEVKVQ